MAVSRKDATTVEGALGTLPVNEPNVALGGKGQDMSLPASVVHLAAWLWQRVPEASAVRALALDFLCRSAEPPAG